jgi:hypothetical protein
MWDKGCCLPRALAFTIQTDKEALEVIGVSIKVARDYDKVRLCIIAEKEAKFTKKFGSN